MFENMNYLFRESGPTRCSLSDHAWNYHRYRGDHCDRIDDQRERMNRSKKT